MFKAFREWCESVLHIPEDPEPPPGDEARTQRFRAAPNYYKYLLFIWGLKSFGVLAILLPMEIGPLFALPEMRDRPVLGTLLIGLPQIIVLLFLFGRVFALALVRLDFEKRWYLVTDRSLRLREGILNVREMTITFANIQNISISQGPIQRALGIADLRVDTAGGASRARHDGKGMSPNLHTAWFRGVENANVIRELIQTRQRGAERFRPWRSRGTQGRTKTGGVWRCIRRIPCCSPRSGEGSCDFTRRRSALNGAKPQRPKCRRRYQARCLTNRQECPAAADRRARLPSPPPRRRCPLAN